MYINFNSSFQHYLHYADIILRRRERRANLVNLGRSIRLSTKWVEIQIYTFLSLSI